MKDYVFVHDGRGSGPDAWWRCEVEDSTPEAPSLIRENYRRARRGYLSSLSARNKFVLILGVPAFIAGGLVVIFEALFR
jgi:hypothetical protein